MRTIYLPCNENDRLWKGKKRICKNSEGKIHNSKLKLQHIYNTTDESIKWKHFTVLTNNENSTNTYQSRTTGHSQI